MNILVQGETLAGMGLRRTGMLMEGTVGMATTEGAMVAVTAYSVVTMGLVTEDTAAVMGRKRRRTRRAAIP
jgi:hypothetical protein